MAGKGEDHALTKMVAGFYNTLNKDTSFVCRLNAGDLTPEVNATFDALPEDIKKRYYGSGINIPEKLEGKRVLDIGCGSGSLVFILAKLVGPSGYVVGFDVTDGLIETAKANSESWEKHLGYPKANFEFHVRNCENMSIKDFGGKPFDIIVSNGVFCLVPDKKTAFRQAASMLKEGGQFYLNDVYAEKDPPEAHKDNETLWSLGTTGAMRWDTLATMAAEFGFTTPYLTCAAPVLVVKEEYNTMLENGRFSCAGWRLFKLSSQVTKKEASRVTYNGNMTQYPLSFPWDINITFPKGLGVDVDATLATILFNSYLRDSFSFEPAVGAPTTNKNQNPFIRMDELEKQGKLPDAIYKIE